MMFEQAQLYPTTRKNLTARMVAMGFKAASVSSILGQMMRQGLLQADDEGVLHLTVGQYTPIKSAKMLRKMEAAKAKAKAKHKQIKVSVRNRTVEEVREERPVSSSPMPVAPPEGIPRVDALLRSLSILEAQELYAALKDIFGDNK